MSTIKLNSNELAEKYLLLLLSKCTARLLGDYSVVWMLNNLLVFQQEFDDKILRCNHKKVAIYLEVQYGIPSNRIDDLIKKSIGKRLNCEKFEIRYSNFLKKGINF